MWPRSLGFEVSRTSAVNAQQQHHDSQALHETIIYFPIFLFFGIVDPFFGSWAGTEQRPGMFFLVCRQQRHSSVLVRHILDAVVLAARHMVAPAQRKHVLAPSFSEEMRGRFGTLKRDDHLGNQPPPPPHQLGCFRSPSTF